MDRTENAWPFKDIRVPEFVNTIPTVIIIVLPQTAASLMTAAGSANNRFNAARLMALMVAVEW
jgi:hypothetical protein